MAITHLDPTTHSPGNPCQQNPPDFLPMSPTTPATPSASPFSERLRSYLADDLRKVVAVLDTVYHVDGVLMQQVADYLVEGRGKMMRPALVCLSARAHGINPATTDHHINLAAAIELFHVATLLHDDVIDKAPLRRGRATVNAKWGDDAAILFADYLYASSFDLALSTLNADTLRILTQTTQRMTEGEFLQMERRGDWLSVEDYLTIIDRKTAQLFSASAGLGALIAGAGKDAVNALLTYGIEFGLAFQITDDTLDYEAQSDQWGKRVGADLKEGKQTLPLLRTLALANAEDSAQLRQTLATDRDFPTVQRLVTKYEAIPYSLGVARQHCARAAESLSHLPADHPATALLRELALGLIDRAY
ncbi:MAG: polyprenyl synthetase family protein [Candidatus Sumerlaeia bacterium]|nr:polyprenyl synthetase family protein [Candidatus Sumerlaeia bacterium]